MGVMDDYKPERSRSNPDRNHPAWKEPLGECGACGGLYNTDEYDSCPHCNPNSFRCLPDEMARIIEKAIIDAIVGVGAKKVEVAMDPDGGELRVEWWWSNEEHDSDSLYWG